MRKSAQLLKLALPPAMLFYLMGRLNISLTYRDFLNLHPLYLAGALAVLLFHNFLSAFRWNMVSQAPKAPGVFLTSLRGVMVGGLLNQCLPSGLAGEFYRYYLFRTKGSGVKTAYFIFTDRLMTQLGWVPPALGALAFNRHLAESLRTGGGLSLTSPLLLLGCGIVLMLLLRLPRILAKMKLFTAGSFFRIWGLSILMSVLIPVALWLCLLAGGAQVSFTGAFSRGCVLLAILAIPLTPGSWGSRELGILFLYQDLGPEPAALLLISVTFGLLNLWSFAPGVLWLYRSHPGPTTAPEVVREESTP